MWFMATLDSTLLYIVSCSVGDSGSGGRGVVQQSEAVKSSVKVSAQRTTIEMDATTFINPFSL